MPTNLLLNSGFESGVLNGALTDWIPEQDCNVYSVIKSNNRKRSGSFSCRIQSRMQVGGFGTCGAILQNINVTIGETYVFGVYWNGQGLLTGSDAHVTFGAMTLPPIVGSSGPGLWIPVFGIWTATYSPATFLIAQLPGSSSLQQFRYYDDAFVFVYDKPKSLSAIGGFLSSLSANSPTKVPDSSFMSTPIAMDSSGIPQLASDRLSATPQILVGLSAGEITNEF